MAIASQPTNDQPTLPPAGDADSLAGVGPANSNQTSVTVTNSVTEVVTTSTAELDKRIRATMTTCGQLVAERDRATAELRRHAKHILYPDLIEMRKHYKNAGARTDLFPGIPTFEAYLASIGFCSSILRVWDHRRDHRHREKQKELESLLPSQGQKQISSGPSGGASGSSSPVTIDSGNAVVVDATSAMVNLGYKRSDAKQAVEQALTADATLANDLSGLTRAALAKPSYVKAAPVPVEPAPVDDDSLEYDIPAVSHTVIPALTRRVSPSTPTPVVSYEERDREELRNFVKRLNSISIALQQVVDGKAKWSKYAEYAEVVSLGEKIADLVKLM